MTIELSPAMGILAIAVLAHAASTIWWAAKVNTLLNVIQKTLLEISTELKVHKSNTLSRSELERDRAVAEKEHKALWNRIDELKNKVEKSA